MSEENESKLRIKDRRMFNPDGSLRTPDPDEEPRAERGQPTPTLSTPAESPRDNVVPLEGRERGAAAPPAAESRRDAETRETDASEHRDDESTTSRPGEPSLFADLVSSLAYQAAMLMGLIRDPLAPQMPTDMRGARQTIEMLAMLKDKTRGNLSADEATLLERALTDLRMQFVAMAQRSGKL
jgi:hypothetical protein